MLIFVMSYLFIIFEVEGCLSMISWFCCNNGNSKFEKNVLFSFKIRLYNCICGNITTENCKQINLQTLFSKRSHKMSMRKSPTKNFLESKFVNQKFVKKFCCRGPNNRWFWGLFSKIDLRNFDFGKSVLLFLPIRPHFLQKIRKYFPTKTY